jgi:hypothetical protein
MDVKSVQNLVLTRLRDNLVDVRTSNIRPDNRKWILSRFPDDDESKSLDEFKEKFGYPLIIVQTPSLTKAIMYSNGGMSGDYSMILHIQHIGELALHDTLIKNIFDDFKLALETDFYLQQGLYFDEMAFEPNSDDFINQEKVYNSKITISFKEDE